MAKKTSRHKPSVLPRIRVMCGKEIALGPGKVDLLEHIQKTGSIVEAARHMEMSYNRAWQLVHTMNDCFKEPLVAALRGGKEGGGAELTALGRKAVELYRRMESKTMIATAAPRRALDALLKA